jgi:hypothetical protein
MSKFLEKGETVAELAERLISELKANRRAQSSRVLRRGPEEQGQRRESSKINRCLN